MAAQAHRLRSRQSQHQTDETKALNLDILKRGRHGVRNPMLSKAACSDHMSSKNARSICGPGAKRSRAAVKTAWKRQGVGQFSAI
jgi:hypothetical protein